MKTKAFLTPLLVLLGLAAAGTSAYFFGRPFLHFSPASLPGLPPLSRLDLSPQTMNEFTAELESYYADAHRLIFVVRVYNDTKEFLLDSASFLLSEKRMVGGMGNRIYISHLDGSEKQLLV